MSFIVKKKCRIDDSECVGVGVCGMTVLMVFDVALIAVVIKHESLRGRDPSHNVNSTTHTQN